MGFLAPWMLLGALTAGVPIALHLIRRNKPTVVPWAAMDFLLRSVRETRSASRFRDMMLLVCRVFVLVLATLALARPLASWVPGTGPVDLALLLDVSGSMRTEEPTATGPRSRFSLARDEAERLVRALPAGSRVRLMPFGDRVEAGQTPSEPLEPALVLESLGRLRQTDLATRLEPALDMAADALAQSDMANKRLWIISDANLGSFSGFFASPAKSPSGGQPGMVKGGNCPHGACATDGKRTRRRLVACQHPPTLESALAQHWDRPRPRIDCPFGHATNGGR